MDQMELIEKIIVDFIACINKHLPKKWISSSGSSGPRFHAVLSEKNSSYVSSEYFYEGERKFVHWTNIQNLMSIINSRQIRLYNLQNPNDEKEFKYAGEKLTIPDNIIDYSKNYLYTFSFCESKEKDNPILWSKYGNDYSGATIEFEILNNPEDWINFMLSRTYYELPEKLIRLVDDLKCLKKKWSGSGIETEIDLGRLIAFHKHPDFKDEQEIRLSSYYPYVNIEAILKYCNTEFRFDNKRPRITDYFGLYLWVDNESSFITSTDKELDRRLVVNDDYFIKNPKLKITNISIGENCGISNLEYRKFKKKLEEIIRFKLGYRISLPWNLYERKH
jgi:hypothetical protein